MSYSNRTMYSRRQFGRAALAAVPWSLMGAKIDSRIRGVQFGLQSYSFNGLPLEGILDVVIASMVDTGLGECEIWSPLIEPPELVRWLRTAPDAETRAEAQADLGRWSLSVSLDYFRQIRRKFADAGIEITAFSANPGSSDEELNRTFEIAEALGAGIVTLASPLSIARRVAPMAERHDLLVGLQGIPTMHPTNPDQIARPENYEEAVALSKNFRITIDIGDAVGGGYDALKFVEDHHERIFQLFLKDRTKANVSVPWGEGDTPIAAILKMIRDRKWPIRGYIDNDYKSPLSRAEDVKRSVAYAKRALE